MIPKLHFGSKVLLVLGQITALLFFWVHPTQAKREHLVHFPNTVYELNIYKIYGKQPGKTLMLIGGIQGNEPGGFLSADLYADMSLEKGNLIVVPRANFYSIILNKRGPNGDMNRKFTHKDSFYSMEDKIVSILKKLISESDYLLNLHDGAGYYYPEYINKWRNPMRFGQAIIADYNEYHVPGTDKVMNLEEMAEKVVREVNQYINNDLYQFHFMNTRTDEADSRHPEQRKSATYYALTRHHIPAFGVETSKFLPSVDLKVQYHNLVINAFMTIFDIIPHSPSYALEQPKLDYLVVSINNKMPVVIKCNQVLELEKGDRINISHIEANYERGLSLDILGYGDLNDYRQNFEIFRDTNILVRKDNHEFADIPVKIRSGASKAPARQRSCDVDYLIIEAKGYRLLLSDKEVLSLTRGEKFRIMDVIPQDNPDITVNFKGFVGDKVNNTGEDRGYLIDTSKDLMKRYSLNNEGELYQIIISRGNEENTLARMFIKIVP